MNKLIIVSVAAVAIIGGGAFFALQSSGEKNTETEDATVAEREGVFEEMNEEFDVLTEENQALPEAAAPSTAPPANSAVNEEARPEGVSAEGVPTGGGQGRGAGAEIDLTAAATALGVSEAELQAALGESDQGRPDFASAAVSLGVTEAELMDALGMSESGVPPGGGERPGGGRPQ